MGIITHLGSRFFALLFLSLLSIFVLVHTKSSSLDAAVMLILRQNLNASKSLGWIDPDPCQWQHVSCSEDGRVTRIQIGYQNLTGCLPSNLSYLTALQILDLSSNQLQGPLPSLAGLSSLQNLSLSNNNFSSIPFDFFSGMTSLERVYLDNIPFHPNPIPISLQSASNLKVFSANASNFSCKIPHFFGTFARLTTLHLAFNNLHGVLPGTFSSSSIQSLWLNEQQSTFKLHGPIDFIQNMTQLKEVWLDSNSFSGPMPDFSRLMGLESFRVRDNSITGQVPASILDLPWLKVVSLTNNLLQGPTPKFNSSVTIDMETGSNSFCSPAPGAACNPRVNTLLSIAQFSGYPVVLSENWKGNDPCKGWFGLHCENDNITVVNFSNLGLTGMISPNFSSIVSLQILILASNNLAGMIPNELTTLPNLRELDISNNCLHGKIPSFKSNVVVNTNGNPDIWMDVDSGNRYLSVVNVGLVIGGICVVLFVGILIDMCKRKHYGHIHVIESERMVISIHVLKNATSNFSQENILGRGGFGVVYKGALHDGTKIAVKRMDSGVLCERGWDQFKSEIVVLSKVRHKHLVSLFGYCLDANERLLVYEYMPQGTLSRHLFRWKEEGLKPLEWLRRLTIALDVARGVEYLHVLAHRSFIHRDLKPSNILLGDDMHAKVGDFGLVRLVPDGKSSILTKLAGTFGYLAPEYAVTGRVTTKIDVFSFGVILLQLITGRKAVVELETEHDEYVGIVAWFYKMRRQKDVFHKAIDSTINLDEETLVSIDTVAELAGHCCANNHSQRPDMGHIVSVLSTLVDHWSPSNSHCDEGFGSFGEVKPKDYSHIF